MSKPIARVALVSLISLVLIAATYMTVQGSFVKTDSSKAADVQAHQVSGLQTNFNHDRSTVSELEALQQQSVPSSSEPGAGRHQGGCESENHSVPLD